MPVPPFTKQNAKFHYNSLATMEMAGIERLQVTSQYHVIHFRVAKPLMSLECYQSIWSVFVVRTIVLREIIKQREKWEFIFTEFRKIRLNERFGSTQLIERVLTQVHLQSSVANISLVVSTFSVYS